MDELERAFGEMIAGLQAKMETWPALLGDGNGVVEVPGTEKRVYVRMPDGHNAQVFNDDRVPLTNDLPVIIGYDYINPTLLQVLGQRQAYRQSESGGFSARGAHHKSHEWLSDYGGQDTVFSQARQLMPNRLAAVSGLTVGCFNSPILTDTGWQSAAISTLDLASSVPGSGARYVLVCQQLDGSLAGTAGEVRSNKTLLQWSDIPRPTAGQRPLAAALLEAGQTQIHEDREDQDILDLRFPTNTAWPITSPDTPLPLSETPTAGSGAGGSPWDHQHAHGELPGGLFHSTASLSAAGFAPQLPDDPTKFYDGQGNWSPAGGGVTLNKIILVSAGAVTEFEVTDAGLTAAIAASSDGDAIHLPPCNLTGGPWSLGWKYISVTGSDVMRTNMNGNVTMVGGWVRFEKFTLNGNVTITNQGMLELEDMNVSGPSSPTFDLSGALLMKNSLASSSGSSGQNSIFQLTSFGANIVLYHCRFWCFGAGTPKSIIHYADTSTYTEAYVYNCEGNDCDLTDYAPHTHVSNFARGSYLGNPLKSDRSAWDVTNYPALHASDLGSGSPARHNPTFDTPGQVPTWDGSKLVAQIPSSGVPTSRRVHTTAPLSGGGDLTADRTLAISAATTLAAGSMSAADKTKLDGIASGATATPLDSTNPAALGVVTPGTSTSAAHGDHVHPTTGLVLTGRTLNSTAPLTGGGDLSADRTLAISAATPASAGSMSPADKTKLDAITGTNTGNVTLAGQNYLTLSGQQITAGAIDEADITLSDVTTDNVSTAMHGFAPKLPNDASKYLDGSGAYSVPAGGGASPGFNRDITQNTVITTGYGLCVPSYVIIEAGVTLTIQAGATLEVR